MSSSRAGTQAETDLSSQLIIWALVVVGLGAAVVWGGAALATLVVHQRLLPVGLGSAARAMFALPSHASQPALAWPPEARPLVPGPVLYWLCTTLAAAAVGALVVVGHRIFARPGVGTDRRRRLGVDTRARLAAPRDLAPLAVSGPRPGRLILGRVGRRLVATEHAASAPGRRRRGRRAREGDRSALAVIGPTRCGKTANIISGVLEWEGPAILSSVKEDLLEATLARRAELGEVKVFDPTASTGHGCAGWSPLREAATPVGAQRAARAIGATISARPSADMEFFTGMALDLLWPLLYAAAVSGRTMSDVLDWVLRRDQPSAEANGEVVGILEDKSKAGGEQAAGASLALKTLHSTWACDHRTVSSIYVTAQRLLEVWQDPGVVAATCKSEIDLDWLVKGSNTLYICSPLDEQARLGRLFGSLLSDLIAQQAYQRVSRTGRPLPDLLVVLDEAANTPTRWLPGVVSTCSGLGILLVTIWQSKAQIDAAYGVLADSVLTNHGTKVIFSGVSDHSTLEYATRLLGDEEVAHRASSTDLVSGGRSVSESTTRLRLLPADVLRQVAPFQALLLHGTLPPAHLHARPYHLDRRLRRLSRDHGEMP